MVFVSDVKNELMPDGTIGQSNYSTAKAAIMGLTRTLAIEGSRANINVNCIAPRAGTAMTATVWPKYVLFPPISSKADRQGNARSCQA